MNDKSRRMLKALFEPRFGRLEFWSFPFVVWLSFVLKVPWIMLAMIPIAVVSVAVEKRLKRKPD
jgi:hypothetical protein